MEINRNFQGEEQTTIFNLYTMWFTKIDRFKKKTHREFENDFTFSMFHSV